MEQVHLWLANAESARVAHARRCLEGVSNAVAMPLNSILVVHVLVQIFSIWRSHDPSTFLTAAAVLYSAHISAAAVGVGICSLLLICHERLVASKDACRRVIVKNAYSSLVILLVCAPDQRGSMA